MNETLAEIRYKGGRQAARRCFTDTENAGIGLDASVYAARQALRDLLASPFYSRDYVAGYCDVVIDVAQGESR